MDLTLDVEDYKLNIRAAGLIIHNNKNLYLSSRGKEIANFVWEKFI